MTTFIHYNCLWKDFFGNDFILFGTAVTPLFVSSQSSEITTPKTFNFCLFKEGVLAEDPTESNFDALHAC